MKISSAADARNQIAKETYLGDGLYVSYDGYQLQLRAPREDGNHFIYLEPEAYLHLLRFVKDAKCFE